MRITEIRFGKTMPFQMSQYEIGKVSYTAVAVLNEGEDEGEGFIHLKQIVDSHIVDELMEIEELIAGKGKSS